MKTGAPNLIRGQKHAVLALFSLMPPSNHAVFWFAVAQWQREGLKSSSWGFYAHSTYNDHIGNILHQWYHAEPEVDKKKKDWVLCLTVLSVPSHWLWNKGAVAWLHWVIFYCHPDGISWLSESNTWEVSWEIWLGSVKILNTHSLSAEHPKKHITSSVLANWK